MGRRALRPRFVATLLRLGRFAYMVFVNGWAPKPLWIVKNRTCCTRDVSCFTRLSRRARNTAHDRAPARKRRDVMSDIRATSCRYFGLAGFPAPIKGRESAA